VVIVEPSANMSAAGTLLLAPRGLRRREHRLDDMLPPINRSTAMLAIRDAHSKSVIMAWPSQQMTILSEDSSGP
jgi:hypothetical protein